MRTANKNYLAATHTIRRFVGDGTRRYRPLVAGLQWFLCVLLLVGMGCTDDTNGTIGAGHKNKTDEQKRAETLRQTPIAAPDTPEEIEAKTATVEATLPRVYELLDEAGTDVQKINEVKVLAQSMTALMPYNRNAMIAHARVRLAGFLAKEVTDENGKLVHEHAATVDVSTASGQLDLMRTTFEVLTEDELRLAQEIYFNKARMDSAYASQLDTDAIGRFNAAIKNMMSVGFNDLERLKAEPSFEAMFRNEATASGLLAALMQLEIQASAEDVPATDTSEDEASPQPE